VKKNCGYKLLLHFFKGIVYNFFKMKKKLLKGEISTIITLGTLIVLGVSSLASVVFLKKPQTTKTRAAGCAKVENVSYSGDVAAGKTFTCLAVTDGASPYTMACGISKNGGWPYGMQSGSCSGKNCTFSVKMDDQIEAGAVYQLVAFDFRTECGPDKDDAKRITLNVSGTQPQPTQANCDEGCCGRPDGFIYQRAIKESCDSNYKGGRYVIIDGVCQGGKRTEKPGCATCRTCQAGASDIAPVPDADLAVNECNSSCEQGGGGICSGIPDCPANITPAIVRSCSDTSFSCTPGYTACKKDGAIWCYRSGSSGGGGNPTPNPNSSTPTQTITPNPNQRVKPTNTPIPTNPNPTSVTPTLGKDQPCKTRFVNRGEDANAIEYYCEGNLVCVNGKCVEPTPTYPPILLTVALTPPHLLPTCGMGLTCTYASKLDQIQECRTTHTHYCFNPFMSGNYYSCCIPPSSASAPTPTPFCQNIKVPQIETGINVGLTNEKGEGKTVSIDDMVNGIIRNRIRRDLSGAKTMEEIRFRMYEFISDAILQGIGQALSNLSQQIAQTPFMYIRINDILIPTPFFIIKEGINIVGFVLEKSGIVASLINNLSHAFVNSVINTICQ
jgi:hypothetical protein